MEEYLQSLLLIRKFKGIENIKDEDIEDIEDIKDIDDQATGNYIVLDIRCGEECSCHSGMVLVVEDLGFLSRRLFYLYKETDSPDPFYVDKVGNIVSAVVYYSSERIKNNLPISLSFDMNGKCVTAKFNTLAKPYFTDVGPIIIPGYDYGVIPNSDGLLQEHMHLIGKHIDEFDIYPEHKKLLFED